MADWTPNRKINFRETSNTELSLISNEFVEYALSEPVSSFPPTVQPPPNSQRTPEKPTKEQYAKLPISMYVTYEESYPYEEPPPPPPAPIQQQPTPTVQIVVIDTREDKTFILAFLFATFVWCFCGWICGVTALILACKMVLFSVKFAPFCPVFWQLN